LLDLLACEWMKLRRRKFLLLTVLSALLFPLPVVWLMTTPRIQERFSSGIDRFDGLYNFTLGYAVQLLLPCLIGVLAAMLFFTERDNDTFKSLRTIPVTSTRLVLAKILLLFLLGALFCAVAVAADVLCGMLVSEPNGLGWKLWLAIETGVFITAGTLPLVVLIVFCGRTYVFSVLLCVFYSALNMSLSVLFDVMPRTLFLLLPMPLTMFWAVGQMEQRAVNISSFAEMGNLSAIRQYRLVAPTWRVVLTVGAMALASILVIDALYRVRKEG